jgi:hypothetical protein
VKSFLRILDHVISSGTTASDSIGSRAPYRRFIAKADSNELLTQNGGWTVDDAQAVTFDNVRSMIRTCLKFDLHDAQILLRFTGRKLDVRFPLRPISIARGSALRSV